MKYKFDSTIKMKSKFIAEEYFSAIIKFSSEELNNHFIEFNYKDTDMFEFSVHPETHVIKRFTLTLWNHFQIFDKDISVPNYIDGTIMIDGPDITECETFMVNIYSNGMIIKLFDQEQKACYKSGSLIFAIGDNDELIELYVINLSETEVNHVKNELLLGIG
mgnify:CR=1 FL=1